MPACLWTTSGRSGPGARASGDSVLANVISTFSAGLNQLEAISLGVSAGSITLPVITFAAGGVGSTVATTAMTLNCNTGADCLWLPAVDLLKTPGNCYNTAMTDANVPSVELPQWLTRTWDIAVALLPDPWVDALAERAEPCRVELSCITPPEPRIQLQIFLLRLCLAHTVRTFRFLVRALACLAHAVGHALSIAAVIHTFMSHRHNRESDDALFVSSDCNIRYRRVAPIG